ncbi:hypothetical protein BKA62DRAFT_694810 [Auriculariales sp. MPI-PUGE-AT-0066]|nr:hypothetical protein BKA62DRAFT_694810 [Auriculariales sp. MPI-PUGE-AT-0066]
MRQSTLFKHFKTAETSSKRKRRRVSSDSGSAVSSDSDVGAVVFEGRRSESSTDGENDAQPRRSTRMDSSPAKKRRRISRSPSQENNPSPPRASGSRRAKAKVIIISESDEEDEEEPSPTRKKFIRGVRPSQRMDDESEDGSDHGLDQSNVLSSRLRQTGSAKKSTKFSQALEQMKRRKQQKQQTGSIHEEEEEIVVDEHDSEDSSDGLFADARPQDEDSSDEEGSINDFIAEDEGNVDNVALPAQFRAAQHLSVHFKVVCQYFVHLACTKNRSKFVKLTKSDEYFSQPLNVLRRKIDGMQDSLVTSSVWRTEFKKALLTWPELSVEPLVFSIPSCDACHMGSRTSTLVGHVGGQGYDRHTFETLPETKELDKLKRSFHLGRFCARRTRVYHQFAHWEHDLFFALEARVKAMEGYKKMAPDAVMEKLDQRGTVQLEWKRLNDMIESARHLEFAAKRGEDGDMD